MQKHPVVNLHMPPTPNMVKKSKSHKTFLDVVLKIYLMLKKKIMGLNVLPDLQLVHGQKINEKRPRKSEKGVEKGEKSKF